MGPKDSLGFFLTFCSRLVIVKPVSGRFNSHVLRQFVSDKCCKLSTGLLQVDPQNLLPTGRWIANFEKNFRHVI